jgi:hypothetical protein
MKYIQANVYLFPPLYFESKNSLMLIVTVFFPDYKCLLHLLYYADTTERLLIRHKKIKFMMMVEVVSSRTQQAKIPVAVVSCCCYCFFFAICLI